MKELNQNKTYGKIFIKTTANRSMKIEDLAKELKDHGISLIINLSRAEEVEGSLLKFLNEWGKDRVFYISSSNSMVMKPEYESAVNNAYQVLKAGNILIYDKKEKSCTGTFAVVLLKTCGYSFDEALKIVEEAGYSIESEYLMDFAKNYKSKIKILKEKSCLNCEHGVPIYGYPYECSLQINGKWFHEGGYCPEELICDHWEVDDYHGMEDKSEMWRHAVTITVD